MTFQTFLLFPYESEEDIILFQTIRVAWNGPTTHIMPTVTYNLFRPANTFLYLERTIFGNSYLGPFFPVTQYVYPKSLFIPNPHRKLAMPSKVNIRVG